MAARARPIPKRTRVEARENQRTHKIDVAANRTPRALAEQLHRLGSALGHDARQTLERSVDEYYRRNRLYDGRGRLANSTRTVKGLLKKIILINAWADDEALDQNFRWDCKRFVKRVVRGGNGSQLDDLFHPASKLWGRRQKEGKKRRDLEQHGSSTKHDIGYGFCLKSVTSRGRLKSVGKIYRNCLAKNEHGHHDRLKSGDSAFYVIEHGEGGLGRGLVVEVQCANGKIVEVGGADLEELKELAGSSVALQTMLLCALRHMDGCPDDDGVFVPAGAHAEFLLEFDVGKPHAQTRLGKKRYLAWANERVLIIRRGKAQWSRFVFGGNRWCADYHSALDEADLAGLLAPLWPHLGKLVAKHQRQEPHVEDDS